MPEIDAQRLKDDQKRDWNAAAAGWKKWWPNFERAAQHVSDRLVELAAVRTGSSVLDIATGNGEPAVTAAKIVGESGRVIATDQSPGMLEIARERAQSLGLGNIEFHQSDAEMLTIPYRDFDAVLCRWGLMFMPDLSKALREIRIRMRVGARFATAVWATADKVPIIGIAQDTVRQLANLPPPPPNALEPTRLADTSILKAALEETGFKEVQIERRNVVFEFESAETFTRFREEIAAPFRALLERQTSEMRARIIEGVTNAARKFAGPDGKVRTSNETILFAASA